MVYNFVASTAFINHVIELLPVQQRKQIAKLAINSKFYNFLRQWSKDSD
jgi:hypothetical protein